MSLIPDKNLYVVSSSLRPLTGVWSPEQRFSQTVDTIKSIREKDKNRTFFGFGNISRHFRWARTGNRHYFNYYDVFETFDFSICKVGYDGEEFYFGTNTQQHILEKKLVLEGKPTSDFVKRWFKYSLKGYKMSNEMAAQIIKGLPEVEFHNSTDTGY